MLMGLHQTHLMLLSIQHLRMQEVRLWVKTWLWTSAWVDNVQLQYAFDPAAARTLRNKLMLWQL